MSNNYEVPFVTNDSVSEKNRQRDEIHRKIWSMADRLRGSVDGWDFKSYVLDIIFYRYLSENLVSRFNRSQQDDDPNFRYQDLSDGEVNQEMQEYIIDLYGFCILPSQLFAQVVKNADRDDDLNEHLRQIFDNIEESTKGKPSESAFNGLFNDFNSSSEKLGTTTKEKNQKLADILQDVAKIELSEDWSSNAVDTFGDAYEFLMSMYASSAGKSGGEFFTPQEVSKLMMKIALSQKQNHQGRWSFYDPTCGSGSLLLQAIKQLGQEKVRKLCGQEINLITYNLCRMNMLLHNVEYDQFEIVYGDTLLKPGHLEQKFDVVVSNPPYSTKWAGEQNPELATDQRFTPAGVLAPASKADLAFVMHSLYYLNDEGIAVIVCFPGVMYRGGREGKIREYLIQHNYVDAVIQMPDKLFYGTSIATSLLILKKNKSTDDILFIDASKEFVKMKKGNHLANENIEKIFTTYVDRQDTQISKVIKNDALDGDSLYVSNYVQNVEEAEKIDIKQLNAELAELVKKEDELRAEIDRVIQEIEKEFHLN